MPLIHDNDAAVLVGLAKVGLQNQLGYVITPFTVFTAAEISHKCTGTSNAPVVGVALAQQDKHVGFEAHDPARLLRGVVAVRNAT